MGFDVKDYWENRYKAGRDSGAGSYGRLAKYKADFLNEFVKQHNIKSVLELGCGDGNQLSLFQFPSYVGIDISDEIVEKNKETYQDDPTRNFYTYSEFENINETFDLVLSLDVVYHLSNDQVYFDYIQTLFERSKRYVIIYSNDVTQTPLGINLAAGYIQCRKFSTDVENNFPEWKLIHKVNNQYPYSPITPDESSFADFFIYEKNSELPAYKLNPDTQLILENLTNQFQINQEALFTLDKNLKEKLNSVLNEVNSRTELVNSLIKDKEKQGELIDSLRKDLASLEEQNKNIKEQFLETEKNYNTIKKQYLEQSNYYDDFTQSIIYKSVVEIRKAIVSPGKHTFLLPYKLVKLSAQKLRRKLRGRTQPNDIVRNSLIGQPGEAVKSATIPFNFKDWKGNNDLFEKVDENSFHTQLEQDKYFYFTYKKPLPPLDIDTTYQITPFGKATGNGNIQLFLVEKHLNTKKNFSVPLKTHLIYSPKPGAELSLIIRVQGRVEATIDNIQLETKETPVIQDHAPIDLANVKVAGIFDPFTMECFQPECQLILPTPENWLEILEKERPDVLIVESAWEGNGGAWKRRVAYYPQRNLELYAMIRYCSQHEIPTIFWNKEDPIHTKSFLETARRFDYVFTTDQNCIPFYINHLGHSRVYAMPFAAQPAVHNPIEVLEERSDKIVFAGSYYNEKYSARREDLEKMVEICKDFGLVIYDRNYGKDLPQFAFPAHLKKYIVGGLAVSEIYKAYKGFKFSLNVNSVKDSPTMFSRRVFELIASNTPVVSAWSEGVNKLFGELVISSDNVEEVKEKLNRLYADSTYYDMYRLKGLRLVLEKHTYEERLKGMLKTAGYKIKNKNHGVSVIVNIGDDVSEFEVAKQKYKLLELEKKQLVVIHRGLQIKESKRIVGLDLDSEGMDELVKKVKYDWVMVMDPGAYYGRNYLRDLILALKYTSADVIGKGRYYRQEGDSIILLGEGKEYSPTTSLALGRSIFKSARLGSEEVRAAIEAENYGYEMDGDEQEVFSVDRFNYLEGYDPGKEHLLPQIDDALSPDFSELVDEGNDISNPAGPLSEYLWKDNWVQQTNTECAIESLENGLRIQSNPKQLPHEYLDFIKSITPSSEGKKASYLSISSSGELTGDTHCSFFLVGKNEANIQTWMKSVELDQSQIVEVPSDIALIKLKMRVSGSGVINVSDFGLEKYATRQEALRGYLPTSSPESKILIVTNIYPSKNDLYRNAFVHRRVKLYQEQGIYCEVFAVNPTFGNLTKYHFEGVTVYRGSPQEYEWFISQTEYEKYLVHFVDQGMIQPLDQYAPGKPIMVWIHGYETEKWHRRKFNYGLRNIRELLARIKSSEKQLTFMRDLYGNQGNKRNIKFIFVSKWFKEAVAEEDTGIKVGNSEIIPNVIDTELFNYLPKEPGQRKKILSIRPYANRKYANDLSVKAVLELSKEDFFEDLEFCFIGRGALFDKTLAPLREFKNVTIRETFLQQGEIAELHKEYGVFLCPTRLDAQGVSMCEAMSSGLIPVTSGVTAIPEFVNDEVGILAKGENYMELAAGIKRLYYSAEDFATMSENAARHIRAICGVEATINKEVDLILDNLD